MQLQEVKCSNQAQKGCAFASNQMCVLHVNKQIKRVFLMANGGGTVCVCVLIFSVACLMSQI